LGTTVHYGNEINHFNLVIGRGSVAEEHEDIKDLPPKKLTQIKVSTEFIFNKYSYVALLL
jgi:hypothetical protein